jgi:hypothetical protein
MILRTFWVWHKEYEAPDPEVCMAQDLVDENPEGWEAAKAEVLARYGDSIDSTREIEVNLDYDAVMKNWWPDPIEGRVKA